MKTKQPYKPLLQAMSGCCYADLSLHLAVYQPAHKILESLVESNLRRVVRSVTRGPADLLGLSTADLLALDFLGRPLNGNVWR